MRSESFLEKLKKAWGDKRKKVLNPKRRWRVTDRPKKDNSTNHQRVLALRAKRERSLE